ncbi:LysR family transcriptional regulator [Tepidimicrobium xylanilyticum]|uniref:DNA-binding transcriptional regulator, LysR family n=1 Tax=Tepidimicrobium xylanilyticum TaxID=1123352 RepID=A0A1H2ZKE8_9FIRM|nr:LysR family transcriptional regulator [Tepidimicrobium xylanilyticum]SDX17817.1 DNA-binding transcriptional regulator, LysR family [Tepidimicrobium xylanilyticum]
MTIRHLRIFLEVVKNKSMNAAAAKLYISQPTVSQAIRELEEHYGVLLFERLNRRLYITDAGRRLFTYAKSLVKQFDDLEEKMFNLSKKEKIRIGATITVGEAILSDVINRFNKKEPNIEVYSYMNNTRLIENKLLKSEIDIGIVEGQIKSSDLISIPEVNDYLVLICSTKHPFARKKTIKLEELANENFAMREKGSGTRELFERYMAENGLDIKIAFEGNSPEAIKKEVINNNYLAVISICLVEEEVKNSQIHIIECAEGAWDRYFSIVYHKDKVLTKGMESLIEIIRDYKNKSTRIKTDSESRLIK